MGLFGTIAARPPVACHLPVDGRFVALHQSGNLAFVMSRFGKDRNLIPFVLGECVYFIQGNFDWAVEGLGCSHISPTQPVNQSYTSNLNPRQ